jgi:hypothetical protein
MIFPSIRAADRREVYSNYVVCISWGAGAVFSGLRSDEKWKYGVYAYISRLKFQVGNLRLDEALCNIQLYLNF